MPDPVYISGRQAIARAGGSFGIAATPNNLPGVPDPEANVESLYATVVAIKEIIEILNRQRGAVGNSSVTMNDLEQFVAFLDDRYGA